MPIKNKPPADLIQSVERALKILDSLVAAEMPLSARQLAERVGLKVATAHHLLNTLEHSEFVLRRDSMFTPSSRKIINYYSSLVRGIRIDPEGLAKIRALAERTSETAYLATMSDVTVTIAAVAEGGHAVRVTDVYPGLRGHEHARASGKVLLAAQNDAVVDEFIARNKFEARTQHTITDPVAFRAELDAIRKRGYAIDDEEYTIGVVCVGAVLRTGNAAANSAVVVAMPKARYETAGRACVDQLLEIAGVEQPSYTTSRRRSRTATRA